MRECRVRQITKLVLFSRKNKVGFFFFKKKKGKLATSLSCLLGNGGRDAVELSIIHTSVENRDELGDIVKKKVNDEILNQIPARI